MFQRCGLPQPTSPHEGFAKWTAAKCWAVLCRWDFGQLEFVVSLVCSWKVVGELGSARKWSEYISLCEILFQDWRSEPATCCRGVSDEISLGTGTWKKCHTIQACQAGSHPGHSWIHFQRFHRSIS